jgi:hypothetical protein
MSSQFAEMMEMHRKQQLLEKKIAQGALSFDSPPPEKSHKLKTPFTLTRSAADIISATQAGQDFERDSLASQSSCTTARIRLQEKYVKVATMYKDECSPEEIKESISEIAFNALVKPAIYEDLNPGLGIWRVKNDMYCLATIYFRLRMQIYITYLYVFCFLQQYRSICL